MESPDIWLGYNKLEFDNNVEILGRVFSNNLSSQDHIDIRIRNSRRAMYSIGLNNQALSFSVKACLWRSIGTPSLMYAIKPVIELSILYIAKCIIVKGILIGQLVKSGISPLETFFNSDVIYEGPSLNMNPGLVDSIRYVTNAAFSPGDADHTLLYNLCKFGW